MSDHDLASLRAVLAERNDDLHRLPNVVGTGIGLRRRGGEETGEVCIVVSVERKAPRAELRDDERVPPELSVPSFGSASTDVVETGRVRPLADLAKYRPLRGGCSMLTSAGTGTLGGLAYDPNQGFTVVPAGITCRHCLFRPSFDPPKVPAWVSQGGDTSAIGTIYDRAPMWFSPQEGTAPLNRIDAGKIELGTFLDPPPSVQFDVIDIGNAIHLTGWGEEINLAVRKHGITTGLTRGRIVQIDCTDTLDYGSGHWAKVGGVGSGCFMIESDSDASFCEPGDSGSVVFAQQRSPSGANMALGLVFANAGRKVAFACGIDPAFKTLGLVTVPMGVCIQAWRQAWRRRWLLSHPNPIISFPGASGASWATEEMRRFEELRDYAELSSEPGRALLQTLTAAIPQIADPLRRDPIAFGLYVRVIEKFALAPTVLDLFELEIDDEGVEMFQRLLDRLDRVESGAGESLRGTGEALRAARGKRIADLLQVDLSV